MANHKSALKRVRQNEKRKEINRSNRSKLRTSIKKVRAALTSSDKAVNKGIIHRNTAARHKSRLTKHVNALA